MVSSILLLFFFSTLAQASPYPDPDADPAQLLILKLEESDRFLVDGDDVNIQLIPDHEKDLGLPSAESSNDHQLVEITKEASEFNGLDANPKALTILDMINQQEPDADGRKCVNKTMMRRETEYDEVLRCDHSYDERCHTTYVTSFEPHQEEECDEKFRKVCMISNEQKAVTEMVEECTTPLVPDCERENIPDVCRTVYDTVCDTKQVGYEVEEQFPNCTTVNMEKCEDVTIGLITENRCEVWPVQQCSVENRTVTHSNPKTECRKEPRELCAPGDCPLVEVIILFRNTVKTLSTVQGGRVCANKMKTVVVDSPVEECDMEPQQVCRQTTKLVPQLKPALECVQVPKEVCATSKINPKVIMIPYIQKWCFKPEEVSPRLLV